MAFITMTSAVLAQSVFTSPAGLKIPIQSEWVVEADPAAMQNVPMEKRPWRFNQRTPTHIASEERPGQNPIHYFRDVRWKEEKDPATGRHRALYTTVRVDMDRAQASWMCLKPFAPKIIAGHSALLLEMAPGGFTNLEGEDGGGFVLSMEALMHAGQHYSMIQGQMGKFPIVYCVSTWKDFLYKSIAMDDSVVKRWKLALSPAELKALEIAIGKAVIADHAEQRYNTLTNSCVTAALEVINQAVAPARQVKKDTFFGLLPNLEASLPAFTDRALRKKGLIDGDMEEIEEIKP